jgi:hypothetical protein
MASEVILVQGLTIRMTSNAQTVIPPVAPSYVSLDCIGREIQLQGGSSTEIDVTTFCSTAKEFRLGLGDSGSFTVNGHWKQGNAAHTAIRTANTDKQRRYVEITFEDFSVVKFLAFVQQRSMGASVDGVVTASYVFRVSGPLVEDDPSGNP